MELYIVKDHLATASAGDYVAVRHKGEELLFNVEAFSRAYKRSTSIIPDTMFDEINAYLKTLSPERLETIWNTYKEIRDLLSSYGDMRVTHRKLRQLIRQLYEPINLEETRHWLVYKSNVRIPSELYERYEDVQGRTAESKPDATYLRDEYISLIVLCMAVRLMVPVWGEYIKATSKQAGSPWKEQEALSLLYDTQLAASPAMNRLRLFCKHMTATYVPVRSDTAVLSGLSMEDIPDWILALAVVRRLSVGELNPSTTSMHMVANLFTYMKTNLEPKGLNNKLGQAKFNGKVTAKVVSRDQSTDDKTSVLEMYKVKQVLADGDIVALNQYIDQYRSFAQLIDPTVPQDLTDICLQGIRLLEHQQVQQHHILLCQYLLAPVIQPHAVPLINKKGVMRLLAVVQALLWHWGYLELALLTTAVPMELDDNELRGSLRDYPKVSRANLDDLKTHYRHGAPGRRRKSNDSDRQTNVAVRSIDLFTKMLTRNEWHIIAPDALISATIALSSEYRHLAHQRVMNVPLDINNQLAALASQHIAKPQEVTG